MRDASFRVFWGDMLKESRFAIMVRSIASWAVVELKRSDLYTFETELSFDCQVPNRAQLPAGRSRMHNH